MAAKAVLVLYRTEEGMIFETVEEAVREETPLGATLHKYELVATGVLGTSFVPKGSSKLKKS